MASFVAMTVTGQAMLGYTQALFLTPMMSEFGWSASQYFLPWSVAVLMTAIMPALAGHFADGPHVRRMLLCSIVCFAISIAALGFVGNSLLEYGIALFFALIFQSLGGTVVYSKIVSLWPSRWPGSLQGIALAGGAAGGIIVPLIAGYSIGAFGWRDTRLLLALLVLLVGFLPTLFFVHVPFAAREGARESLFGASAGVAAQRRSFWLLILIFGFSSVALYGIIGNSVPIFVEKGLTREAGAIGLSLMSATTLFSRLASGAALDLVDSPRISIPWFFSGFLGMALLLVADGAPLMWLGMVLIGVSLGAEGEVAAYFVRRFFGTRSYGQIYGWILAAFSIGASGPFWLALVLDSTGSYSASILLAAGLMAATCALLLLLDPYAFRPSGAGEVEEKPSRSAPKVEGEPLAMSYGELGR